MKKLVEVDWRCIKYAQKKLCIKKHITLDEFRAAWVKFFGQPQNEQDRRFLREGIKDFYEDYLTSTVKNIYEYFKTIVEE